MGLNPTSKWACWAFLAQTPSMDRKAQHSFSPSIGGGPNAKTIQQKETKETTEQKKTYTRERKKRSKESAKLIEWRRKIRNKLCRRNTTWTRNGTRALIWRSVDSSTLRSVEPLPVSFSSVSLCFSFSFYYFSGRFDWYVLALLRFVRYRRAVFAFHIWNVLLLKFDCQLWE